MPRFPGDLIAELEESAGDAAYRALARASGGTEVRADVAREVEATLRWRVDRGRDTDRRHRASSSSGLLDLELARDAVQLALPLVAPVTESLREARRQRFLLDELAVAFEDAPDGARVAERDAVRDVEACLLAHVVQVVRELSREPFELQLRGDLRFERDGRAGIAAHGVSGGAFMRDEDFGVRKVEAFDLDRPVAPLVAALREGLPYSRQILSELRSEHLEVGLHGFSHQPFGRVADLDRLHVELLLHDLRKLGIAVEGSVVAIVRVEHHDELRERHSRLHRGGRARGATELDDPTGGTHAPLEIVVDERRVGWRVARVVDRRRRARRRAAHQVLEHLLGDERHDRREQADERGERLVEG